MTNITEENSSAPDTERDILASHSYGRQLGRVIDALAAVVDHLGMGDQAAVKEFTKIRDEINEIKQKAGARRINRIVADLAMLRDSNPKSLSGNIKRDYRVFGA